MYSFTYKKFMCLVTNFTHMHGVTLSVMIQLLIAMIVISFQIGILAVEVLQYTKMARSKQLDKMTL